MQAIADTTPFQQFGIIPDENNSTWVGRKVEKVFTEHELVVPTVNQETPFADQNIDYAFATSTIDERKGLHDLLEQAQILLSQWHSYQALKAAMNAVAMEQPLQNPSEHWQLEIIPSDTAVSSERIATLLGDELHLLVNGDRYDHIENALSDLAEQIESSGVAAAMTAFINMSRVVCNIQLDVESEQVIINFINHLRPQAPKWMQELINSLHTTQSEHFMPASASEDVYPWTFVGNSRTIPLSRHTSLNDEDCENSTINTVLDQLCSKTVKEEPAEEPVDSGFGDELMDDEQPGSEGQGVINSELTAQLLGTYGRYFASDTAPQ